MSDSDAQVEFDSFVRDFALFIKTWYSSGAASVDLFPEGDVKALIKERIGGSFIEIISGNSELTICYGESHTHKGFGSLAMPGDPFSESVNQVLDIMNCKVQTYSAWRDGHCLGGGMVDSSVDAVNLAASSFKRADLIKVKSWNQEATMHPVEPIQD